MADFLRVLLVLGPALVVGVVGFVVGPRYIDRKFRLNNERNPNAPIVLRIDPSMVKKKELV